MSAGLNLQGNIIKFSYADDDQGGAVPSGSVVYSPVFARISAMKPTQLLLEQGLETPEIYSGILSYSPPTGTFIVEQNYQYQVTWPPISSYYQKKFVIIGVQNPSFNDPRKYLLVTLRRLEQANSNDLQ